MITYYVYISRQKKSFSNEDLDLLLLNARTYNATKNITGILFYFDGIFIQHIEGNSIDVVGLFEKINKDSRHDDIQVLKSGTVPERRYLDWKMLFKNIEPEEVEAFFGAPQIKESDLFGPKDKAYSVVSNLFETISV